MSGAPRLVERVRTHVNALREAGLDTQAFFDALVGIRDDKRLTESQREAIYRLIASESFLWYIEAIRGEPIDRIELATKALETLEKNDAAIKRHEPGATAAELLIDAMAAPKRSVPAGAPTKLERPPRRDEPTKKQRPPKKPPADAPTKLERPPKKKR